MRILIIGSNGMAGQTIKKYLEPNYEVFATFRNKNNKALKENEFDLDVFDTENLNLILEKVKPNFVINCVGILNSVAEQNPDVAIFVNGYFPHYLDRLSEKYNFKLIHISTDCVFSGKKGDYTEIDFKDADSYYGRSKAIGEVNNNRTLTFRTSLIGPDSNENGIGLFNWFMKQTGEVSGFSKVIWTGITTLELAKAIEKSFSCQITGVYNLVNNQKISKYELLKLFAKYMKKDNLKIKENANFFSDKSLICTRKDFDFNIPTYEKMIEEMSEYILKNKEQYNF